MIEYFNELTVEEQESLTQIIQTLYRQTYLLERKYDRRTGCSLRKIIVYVVNI